MKKIVLLLLLALLVAVPAGAVTALWDHPTDSAPIVKYRVAWGTAAGVYTFSQEMEKSACVAGTHETGGAYDCKMVLVGTFVENTTYYAVGYSLNYDSNGNEQSSDPTLPVVWIQRAPGTTGSKPLPMKDLGIYDK